MRRIVAAALLLAALPARADDLADLTGRFGLAVVTQDLSQRIVPQVARPDRPVTMQDLSELDRPACLRAMNRALSVYPPALVRTLVQTVALAGRITAWTIEGGGFQAPGLIALNCDDVRSGAQPAIDSVHNSFAALLLRRAPPDWVAWQALDPPGFRYGDRSTYLAELQDPAASQSSAALSRAGFATTMGLAGRENDFEGFAERAFGRPSELAADSRDNPRMRDKLRLLVGTYLSMAPDMKAYFVFNGLYQPAGG